MKQRDSYILVLLIIIGLFWYSRNYMKTRGKGSSFYYQHKYRCDAGGCLECQQNIDGDYPEVCMPYKDCLEICNLGERKYV